MSSTTVEPDVTEKERVFTAEELDELRRRLGGRGATAGGEIGPPEVGPEPSARDWQSDIELLIKFLQYLDKIMWFLIDARIPDPSRRLLRSAMNANKYSLDEAIRTLASIDSETHETYGLLKRVGLAYENLLAKLDGFRDDVMGRPIEALLDSANKILGSLCEAIPMLEPVREMKEQIEHRVKYGADDEILSLGLYPR